MTKKFFKVFVIAFVMFLMSSFAIALADEPDVLPNNQQACYELPEQVTTIKLITDSPPDPTVNPYSHYLNTEFARQLSNLSFITPKGAIIKLFAGISVADFVNVFSDLKKIRDYTDITDITFVINSPGGDAFTGLSIASLLLKAQTDWGFNIRAEGYGIIASAAVPILAVCRPRNVVPGTILMVHEAALWKFPGRETQSDIKSQDKLMTILGERYIQFLVDHTTTSKETWEKLIKDTTWMTPETAKDLGLVDEVK